MLSFNHLQQRQTRSKQVLSHLLNQQIERNQQLQAQNLELEEEQRRLLNLIQIKIDTIHKMEQEQSKTARNNDSTMEMTHLAESNLREATQTLTRERNILKNKIEGLEQVIANKNEEMGRLRDYYSAIIEKLEHESQQKLDEVMDDHEEALRKFKDEVRRSQEENQNLQEIMLRNSEKVRELSEQLITLEGTNQELSQFKKNAEERRAKIIQLEKQIQNGKRQWEEKQLDIKFEYEEKEMKRQKEAEEKVNRMRRETEEKLGQMKRTQQAKMQEMQKDMDDMKAHYEERINFTILRGQEEKVELRQKYQQDAKIVIIAQIQEKEKELQQKIQSQELLLQDNKKKLGLFKGRCEEKQSEIQTLQSNLQAMQNQLSEVKSRVKQVDLHMLQKLSQIKQLEQKLSIQKQKSQFLQKRFQQLNDESKHSQDEFEALAAQNIRLQTTLKKTTAENQQLKAISSKLEQEVANLSMEMELKGQQLKRISNKLTKDGERREKALAQRKKIVEDQQRQIQSLQARIDQLEQHLEQGQQTSQAKIKQLTQSLTKTTEQKDRISKEQKRFKEELLKVEDKVKTKYIQFEKESERMRASNNQLQENCQHLMAEKENYRKVYETSSVQLVKAKEKLSKMEQKNQRLLQQLDNYQQEMEILKQEIADQQLQEKIREELEKCRQEIIDLKAKLGNANQQFIRLRQQNADMARENVNLNVGRQHSEDQMNKLDKRVGTLQTEKQKLEKQVSDLKAELDVRCQKIQAEMPYINTLIQEKTAIEAELQRSRLENKRKDHLIEVAKRSKAEELIRLQQQSEQMKQAQTRQQREIEEQKLVIQQMNRQKVNTLREAAAKEDIIRQLEKNVKKLKNEHRKSLQTIKGQQEQIEQLYSMVEQFQSVPE